ncbi:MAG: dihydrolipoyl dehydrogenase [Candidatus Promineifilaceae bacterium]|nr:dihydrolipoyl dehydrogenase [Candidatus Promineifilaceae bacterium]
MVMGEETLETQVAVVGGGPGGYAAAFRAADLGLDVTLINAEERLGGVCLLRGCIPSKALLHVTHLLHEAEEAEEWGIKFGEPDVDLEAVRGWKEGVVDRLVSGLHKLGQEREIMVIPARATFEGANRLRLEGSDISHVQFEHAIVATGSRPRPLSDVPFEEGGRVMDSDAALDLMTVPQTLLVVGGGYIGLEMGTVYAALGSRVTLVEMTDGLLPGVDRDLIRPLARRADDVFHAVHLNTKVASLEQDGEGVTVTLEGDAPDEEQQFDRAIVAIGRRPNSAELGLEEAGVEVGEDGFIVVDEQMRTNRKHIYAVGDVAGEPLLAHKAMHEGKVAAEVIAGEPAAFDARCVPAVVYTDPQVAWCGLMEQEAQEQGRSVRVARFPWRASGRALTQGAAEGLTKLLFEAETERLVGMGVVGEGAENLIAEGALAIEMGAVAQDLALTIHPHPTLTETESEAAEAFLGQATHILSRQS